MRTRDVRSAFGILRILIAVMMMLLVIEVAYPNGQDTIAMGRRVRMYSAILGKEILISLHIPGGKAGSNERYPVLYTFQTHFEQVGGAVKHLYDYGLIPKTIVVRIDNYEFGYLTPTKVESDPNSGKADLFLQFFKKELIPFVDAQYQTHPYRVLFSNSWGAMFGVYALLARPEIFSAVIASIPWIPYDDNKRYLITHAEEWLKSQTYKNALYMTMDNEFEILPELESFLNILRKMPRQGLDWEYQYWPEEDHTSTPYRSIHAGLRSLFKGWNEIPPDISYRGLEAIRTHEVSLRQKFGYEIGLSGSALRRAGQEHQRNGDYKKAIAIYEYAVERSPGDAFVYVTLGRAYEAHDELSLARKAFQKAYDLAVASSHPQVQWIKNFLDSINRKMNDLRDR